MFTPEEVNAIDHFIYASDECHEEGDSLRSVWAFCDSLSRKKDTIIATQVMVIHGKDSIILNRNLMVAEQNRKLIVFSDALKQSKAATLRTGLIEGGVIVLLVLLVLL